MRLTKTIWSMDEVTPSILRSEIRSENGCCVFISFACCLIETAHCRPAKSYLLCMYTLSIVFLCSRYCHFQVSDRAGTSRVTCLPPHFSARAPSPKMQ